MKNVYQILIFFFWTFAEIVKPVIYVSWKSNPSSLLSKYSK